MGYVIVHALGRQSTDCQLHLVQIVEIAYMHGDVFTDRHPSKFQFLVEPLHSTVNFAVGIQNLVVTSKLYNSNGSQNLVVLKELGWY